jgi:branched-chain amino acid transport system ATP-binding protein
MDFLGEMGLSHLAQEKAGGLPYGQQRRLEIARALATHPRLLLLDEPAAGMNPQETMELATLIHELREKYNLTILLIEHDMKFVMGLCERMKVLDYGITIAEGTPSQIQSNPAVIKAYLGDQKHAAGR